MKHRERFLALSFRKAPESRLDSRYIQESNRAFAQPSPWWFCSEAEAKLTGHRCLSGNLQRQRTLERAEVRISSLACYCTLLKGLRSYLVAAGVTQLDLLSRDSVRNQATPQKTNHQGFFRNADPGSGFNRCE